MADRPSAAAAADAATLNQKSLSRTAMDLLQLVGGSRANILILGSGASTLFKNAICVVVGRYVAVARATGRIKDAAVTSVSALSEDIFESYLRVHADGGALVLTDVQSVRGRAQAVPRVLREFARGVMGAFEAVPLGDGEQVVAAQREISSRASNAAKSATCILLLAEASKIAENDADTIAYVKAVSELARGGLPRPGVDAALGVREVPVVTMTDRLGVTPQEMLPRHYSAKVQEVLKAVEALLGFPADETYVTGCLDCLRTTDFGDDSDPTVTSVREILVQAAGLSTSYLRSLELAQRGAAAPSMNHMKAANKE